MRKLWAWLFLLNVGLVCSGVAAGSTKPEQWIYFSIFGCLLYLLFITWVAIFMVGASKGSEQIDTQIAEEESFLSEAEANAHTYEAAQLNKILEASL